MAFGDIIAKKVSFIQQNKLKIKSLSKNHK